MKVSLNMRKRSIALMIFLMTFLIILSVGIAGCLSRAPSGTSAPIPSASTSSQINPQSNSLKLGEATILEYNGMKKSVRIVSFDQNSGNVTIESKNIGDKAITRGSIVTIVDWGGVRHNEEIHPWTLYDDLYPGESRSDKFNIYEDLQDRMSEKALNGRLTLYYTLGDQSASWIIKES